ncbi:MAG: iron uptake system protein EfeO [Janthinobacterium lividum]
MTPIAPAPLPTRAVRTALVFSALLVLIGLALFYQATRFAQHERAAEVQAVTVNIGARGCTPATLSVPAGSSTFAIHNTSDRAVEWEILDGVMVLEERENIAPGFTQTLSTTLTPGTYAMTCGLLGNPRGQLKVTPSNAAQAAAPVLSLTDFIGPLSEYRVYVGTQSSQLADASKQLASALQAGDLARARAAYAQAHADYARIAPVAGLFADLDHRIDAPASLFDKREADPAFSGFQRIAYGLALGQTRALQPVADALVADVATLSGRLDDLSLQPSQLATSAARRLDQLAAALPGSDAAHDASDTPAQTAASLEGVKEIAQLLAPLMKNRPDLAQPLSADISALEATLMPLRANAGYTDAPNAADDTHLGAAIRQRLATQLTQLAGDFRRINPALGLDRATFQ